MSLELSAIHEEFPILNQTIRGKRLVYLDSAATSLKPACVIDSLRNHHLETPSNVHRGIHYLSEKATKAFDLSRETVRAFLNATKTSEIIFTSGATASINLVAKSFGSKFRKGDEIVVSQMEHHSNIVPWQMLCEEKGCVLRVIPVNDTGDLLVEDYESLLNERTRLVCVVHVSNALGTINPVKKIIDIAHERGIPVLVDGAQSVSHLQVDVRKLDCDFFCFFFAQII